MSGLLVLFKLGLFIPLKADLEKKQETKCREHVIEDGMSVLFKMGIFIHLKPDLEKGSMTIKMICLTFFYCLSLASSLPLKQNWRRNKEKHSDNM